MFSTPLSNAPQGFNYQGHNEPVDNYTNYNSVPYSNSGHYNNPWIPENHDKEFSWLNGGENATGDNRYWMKTFNAEAQTTDGYFPTQRGALFSDADNPQLPLASEISHLFIQGSDEYPSLGHYRYPYGMDFYTWYEPEYHWINFKRNGPNHWHSDVNHEHLDYYGDGLNVNEEELIVGRGYMASIAVPTYLQSHGKLNGSNENETIALTTAGFNCTGWNLVGNPYHGYIDFSSLVDNNSSISPFYVIYDADTYDEEQHGSGFRCYPRGGSKGGDYAGPYLHPHQGFFVEATGGGTLTFKESMLKLRSEVDDASFRDERPEYPLVNLYLSSDKGCNDLTVVEFKRPEWGGANKLRELREGNGLFYGYHDGERYAALFAKEDATRVPLWFEAKEDDIFTMKWKTANADFNSLYLIDNILGIQYDMLANDTYTFEGHKQDYYARFYIVFDVTGMEELEGSDDFVFFDGSQWVVTGDGDLDFIDMHGRILRTEHVSGQTRVTLPKVASSVYLFRLSNPQGVKLQKVVVNNY